MLSSLIFQLFQPQSLLVSRAMDFCLVLIQAVVVILFLFTCFLSYFEPIFDAMVPVSEFGLGFGIIIWWFSSNHELVCCEADYRFDYCHSC